MRALLLAAGRGTRFRPVAERVPKPLFPWLNVELARSHLARLRRSGVEEAALNLHHLGQQIVEHLVDRGSELPHLRFFPEPEILGTAGALRNAAPFLSEGDFLVVNSDAAIEPDYEALVRRHRESGRMATLLVVENREPDRYTPLQAEGDRVTGFGRKGVGTVDGIPLLYTGVCVLSPRLLPRIPPGETSLVANLWQPLLEGGEEIGWGRHEGPFADLGRPRDFLRASLEAVARGGPFPLGSGTFDESTRVLSLRPIEGVDADRSVIGRAALGARAHLAQSVVWDGTSVGARARLDGCLLAGGVVLPGATFEDVLLWAAPGEPAAPYPFASSGQGAHETSPRR